MPSSASAKAGSNASHASGAPSSPCLGAEARSVSGDSTIPTATSFNLALGSAMASIGLTIPAIAVASIWLEGPLILGLGSKETVLLAITIAVGALTVVPGRATLQEGVVHLVLLGAFVFLAVNP